MEDSEAIVKTMQALWDCVIALDRHNKRNPRDPATPKHSSNLYVYFTNHMRPILNKELPRTKFVELENCLGERWRALILEQKKEYEEMAAQDKIKFQIQMQQYYTANQADEIGPIGYRQFPMTGMCKIFCGNLIKKFRGGSRREINLIEQYKGF